MKKYIYILPIFLLISITSIGQNNMDIIKTNLIEKAKFLQDGVYIDKKINIIEERKQLIDTRPSDKNLLNQKRLDSPIKVNKIIRLDSNSDDSYDKAIEINYMIKDDEVQNLICKTNDNSTVEKMRIPIDGEMIEAYDLGVDGTPVFGYINEDNEFVVEYF